MPLYKDFRYRCLFGLNQKQNFNWLENFGKKSMGKHQF